jgi:hypothetical protein
VGNAGSARATFKRAIERGNVVAAEMAAREMRGLSLEDALELVILTALRDVDRGQRFAIRWLRRWIDERRPTMGEVVMVTGSLAALGDHGHQSAVLALRQAAAARPMSTPTGKPLLGRLDDAGGVGADPTSENPSAQVTGS